MVVFIIKFKHVIDSEVFSFRDPVYAEFPSLFDAKVYAKSFITSSNQFFEIRRSRKSAILLGAA